MAHRLPVADIKFIADFAAFCRTKGDEAYDYYCVNVCALGQYGIEVWSNGCSITTDEQIVPLSVMDSVITEPWTFSSVADRLEALIADAPRVS